MCCNRHPGVALKTALLVVFSLPVLACAPKKYHPAQINNVHLHGSGGEKPRLDVYVTIQDGALLYITACGDTQLRRTPKAWTDGEQIEIRSTTTRVYIKNPGGKDYACDLLGQKHAKPR
jgi:hypothetical protein